MNNHSSLWPDQIDPSWNSLLTNEFKQKVEDIGKILEALPIDETSGYRFFPEAVNVLRFLTQDLRQVKCIILGMDPYPSWYEKNNKILPVATGKSFEVGNIESWQQKFKQSSLRNILKTIYLNETGEKIGLQELRNKLKNHEVAISEPHEWFDSLQRQGVIFLNATLTVQPGIADSHTKLWADIMTEVIQYIDSDHDIKWLLFGNKAQERIITAIGDKENIFKCCHPRLAEFVDENIFQHVPGIDWLAKE